MKNDKTKKLLEDIQQKITELDSHLNMEELEGEALISDYEDTLDSTLDQLEMALYLFPSEDTFKTLSFAQKDDFMNIVHQFKGRAKAILTAMDVLEDRLLPHIF